MSYQVEILALGDTALINLRGTKTALGHFESALEMEFPKSAQAVCSREGITVLSLAPDHWGFVPRSKTRSRHLTLWLRQSPLNTRRLLL